MARVNIDILGISELKCTRMGEFNSDDHYIYYCGQESLRRNGVALIVNKKVQNAYFGATSKMIEWFLFFSKPFNITVIQVYDPTTNAEVEWFYEDLQDLLVQFSSVAQLCPTLGDPMYCSTPGLPIHHQFPESTQTHVHQVGDAIQQSHPLSSSYPPAPNSSQH